MTDTLDIHQDPRLHALIVAHDGGHPVEAVLDRAKRYHEFLTGGATVKAAAPAAGGWPTTASATAGKASAAGKAPAAGKPATAPAASGKPAAGKTPAAGAAKVQPPSDTKDPQGRNTYGDVVKALQAVNTKINKATALDILIKAGGGVMHIRDLKPALYDTVVEAATAAISDEAADAGLDPADAGLDPVAGPETDELGNSV